MKMMVIFEIINATDLLKQNIIGLFASVDLSLIF